jgi:hypothetical protein
MVRNRLGIAALILVLVAIALPIIGFIVFTIGVLASGATGDAVGYEIVGAFFVAGGISALASPIAIVGVVLGIISLRRAGERKLQGILAIVLGIAPAIAAFGIPATLSSLPTLF